MGMVKTTLYLPESLKRDIERIARERGVSEADVIRESLAVSVSERRPRPRAGVVAITGQPPIDWNSRDHLQGFGDP
ncbi:hypothetical protein M2152_001700 [Microbacteriaceae bacterium SG_E_30_P1]|uniref:Ribbon-helix-helix protein CopG domain-containing protein n=2 Tax=Antiquaquibacter oligotrophicus TaxID=2880260 RepID=A0ABT6KND6_9MICO|nr:hypothetical protein [Antiquaquibacter oligotrophicus]